MKRIVIFLILFCIISLANLYQYSIDIFSKQLIWYFLGFISLFILNKFNIKSYRFVFILYLILNVLLLYLLLFGDSINGSKAWIKIFNFSFQPSEFMKVVLIILLSYTSLISKKLTFLYFLIPSVLTFLEPDTGNVIFYILIYLSVVGIKFNKYILLVFLIGVFVLLNSSLLVDIIGVDIFYRLDRFIYFKDNYQLNMALLGISNSGIYGIQEMVSVPEAITDFMFTFNIMNYGLIGLVVYLVINLSFNIFLIEKLDDLIGIDKLILRTFIVMKLFQEGIHIGMNVGFLPITGITLPFISYGGSSLISYVFILSFIFNNKGKVDI